MFTIMAIKISPRNDYAPKVQEILTKFGCIIHTRLGLHEATVNSCSNSGLILLNLISQEVDEIKNLEMQLKKLEGIKVELIEL
ncbi:hypothetical protein [Clostridium tarantellae]|uniref:Iron-only hydrogenase system regulator n=1 Tax=Clostridium tarantellae TaxID=39493 RepID=A0A6I1MJ47_9CLOT|nr:hypothetical protein [Clostridium tarantellae]MPQ42723.1 hypothetical protein [Clostridium tarantellae]